MNTPNKLTLLRICLIPFFAVFLLLPQIPMSYLIAGIIFGAASITDYFDGKIARRDNLITNFGKLMDPVADKLLVAAAFICFIETGLSSSWVLIIVLLREFLVTSVRMVSAGDGNVIAANNWGKVKTVSQIVAIATVMTLQFALQLVTQGFIPDFGLDMGLVSLIFNITGQTVIWISCIFTIISGVIYIRQNKDIFKSA